MIYTCPVCGYNQLPDPPEDWTICPCCNTMFGYSDVNWGVDELRREWIANGARWGIEDVPKPELWSPIDQLRNIGYEVTDADKIAIAKTLNNTFHTMFEGFRIILRSVTYIEDQQESIVNILVDESVTTPQQSSATSDIMWQPA